MNRARLIVSQNEDALKSVQPENNPTVEMFKEARNASTYSFGGGMPALQNGDAQLKVLFQQPSIRPSQPSREPQAEATPNKFVKQFRSVHRLQPQQPRSVVAMEDYYQKINNRNKLSSPFQAIYASSHKPAYEKFASKLDFEPPSTLELVVNPGLQFANYTHEFEKDGCKRIYGQLAPAHRRCFKPGRDEQLAPSDASVLDLKHLDFYAYSEAILEKSSNLLFESVVKSFGVMSIDEEILLPERYEIKQRKQLKSTGTLWDKIEINTDPTPIKALTVVGEVSLKRQVDIIRLEIEQEKARKEKPNDYNEVLERKLLELFDKVLQGEIEYKSLDNTEKIKRVLKDIDRFKGKYLDGDSKINLLLYFFREFKALKDRKDAQKKLEEPTTARNKGPSRREKMSEPDNKSLTSRKAASEKSPLGKNQDDDAMWIGSAIVK